VNAPTASNPAAAHVTAVLSMLHEPAARNSATRLFRGKPVLRWTMERLARASRVSSVAIVCWEDQLQAVLPVAEVQWADVLAKGPRTALPEIESVVASRRWADGWRGGLLGTCEFDRGFHAGWFEEVAKKLGSDALLLVDPSAGLIDAALIDDLVEHAEDHSKVELCFMPAAPGLSGALLRLPLLTRLAAAKTHPGRLLHYTPDVLSREMLAGEACAPVPTSVARTTDRFTLDSDRQVERISAATFALNGQLISSPAEDLVARMRDRDRVDAMPREVVLELNTARATRPVNWPGRYHTVSRPDLSLETAARLFAELGSAADDVRLTIGGMGDPLLSGDLLPIVEAARAAGIAAIHLETDFVTGDVAGLARADVDVVSVHVPAITPETYARMMGVDTYAAVLENVRAFITERARRGRGVPILAPTFPKCRDNLAEMEAWYDQWLRAVGAAVITGPSDYAGQIPDAAVADMSPPRRRPCSRLWSRAVIRSNGGVVACEQDFAGRNVLGNVNETTLAEIWQNRMAALRADHRAGRYAGHALCGACREWDRP
jgi:radical SAM protein with 4Fe4S-binding SPASM domain